ncbi:MAG: ribbon-helix-helix protein, CopG family [Streptosporangiaceae bacterium]
MTESTTVVQARLPREEAERLDADRTALGLANRSQAVREGLRLLHREARHAALARSYDEFYGAEPAPVSEVAAAGDEVAAATIADREAAEGEDR